MSKLDSEEANYNFNRDSWSEYWKDCAIYFTKITEKRYSDFQKNTETDLSQKSIKFRLCKYKNSNITRNIINLYNYLINLDESTLQKTLLEKLDKSYKEEQKRIEDERIAKEKAEQAKRNTIQFGSNGLLVEHTSDNAERVITLLLAIPGHANGAAYHAQIDPIIDQLSAAEAIHVIHRIEGAGFGQTGDGLAGVDSPATHRNFIERQVNNRFGGSIHALLKKWGTYSYGGY